MQGGRLLLRGLLAAAALAALWGWGAVLTQPVQAQSGAEEPLSDPLVHGAWLYEGNCVRCHGPYERERVGRRLDEEELEGAIAGSGRDRCAVRWSRSKGGSLSGQEIDALVAYITAWEDLGGPPDLPELPPQPTPTPTPSPTGAAGGQAVPATPTPTPDPQVLLVESMVTHNAVAQGAWLYSQNCQRCHGEYSMGRMALGRDEDYVEKSITNGKSGTNMKAFGRSKGGSLTASEINAIVAYVFAWEQLKGAPALPPFVVEMANRQAAAAAAGDLLPIRPISVTQVAGDAARGRVLYGQHCATCHGAGGEGGIGKTLARPWAAVRPDLTMRAVIRTGVPNTLMPPWSESSGGPLSDAEIDDLVAYVLLLSRGAPPASEASFAAASDTIWQGPLGMLAMLAGVSAIGGLALIRPRRR